jgi:hypothetical protein
VDGTLPHLNLEVEASKSTKKEKGGGKFGTGTFAKDTKLQQQLATLQLGETIGKRPRKSKPSHTENGRDGSECQPETIRKRGSKLNFLHNSLKRNKQVVTLTQAAPSDTSFEGDTAKKLFNNASKHSSNNTSTSSLSPIQEPGEYAHDYDLSQSKPFSLSEDSDISSSVSSVVSSVEVGKDSFRRENSYGTNSFVDPDNVIGYSDTIPKNSSFRPRGRSVSDSLFGGEGSREFSLAEIQRATENEKKKNRRFHEWTKILSERKNIIIDLQDLTFVRKVGEGAFSEVWEGYWNGVHVAIKKLKSMVDDELFQARFLREVESLRKGNHQNVVMFFGVCLRPACIITEVLYPPILFIPH